jgi:hypothetical protein
MARACARYAAVAPVTALATSLAIGDESHQGAD